MIGVGDFRDWAADFFSVVVLSATIFIPTDFDATDISSSGANPHRLSVGYHIVPQHLSFKAIHSTVFSYQNQIFSFLLQLLFTVLLRRLITLVMAILVMVILI